MIDRIKFSNYKLFKSEQELEFKSITVLFGKNNTGKSAVLKLPIIISQGLKGEMIKWEYLLESDNENSIELGNSFKDLVFNKNAVGSLNFEFHKDTIIFKFSYHESAGFLEIYKNGIELENIERFKTIKDFVNSDKLNFDVEFIDSIRRETELRYSKSSERYKTVGVKGQNAIHLLIDSYDDNSILFSNSSNWIRENFEGWELDVVKNSSKTSDTYELVLKRKINSPINIRQTGQGIQQVYPLLVNSFLKYSDSTLTILQEPETHLHPAAHGNLAERFVKSSLEDKNRKYLIETHSLNFILRLRALIAKKVINPEFINLYYVDFLEDKNESILRKIEITENGDIKNSDWPENVFDESLIEISTIIQAQNEGL